MLVGLKTDVRDEIPRPHGCNFEHGQELAAEIGSWGPVECSALTNNNVDWAFYEAIRWVCGLEGPIVIVSG